MILPDDQDAAKIMTVTGWVSAKGNFFGDDERLARYDGSTHRKCPDCGEIIVKHGYCRDCYIQKQITKFESMPRRVWNGTDMLYSQSCDRYFNDADDLANYCEAEMIALSKIGELRLIICVPVYATEIDPSEQYHDDLPDEFDDRLPSELERLFNDLNEGIRESKIILSWTPGKFALNVDEYIITNQ